METRTIPTPPPAWLAVYCYSDGERRVGEILESPCDEKLLSHLSHLAQLAKDHASGYPSLLIIRDDPSLDVLHSGITIQNPACLTARDNWFVRYGRVVEPYLRDAKRADVFTFAPGELADPFSTFKSSANGPFPIRKGASPPICELCQAQQAFIGVLDFRNGGKGGIPHGSLVFHGCSACGVMSSHSFYWLEESDAVELCCIEPASQVLVGTRWKVVDYLTPCTYPEEITSDSAFLREREIFQNFSVIGDKVGGHLFWIQGENIPIDSTGRPMTFIGQFTGSRDVAIGDAGLAYIFYSFYTGETEFVFQDY